MEGNASSNENDGVSFSHFDEDVEVDSELIIEEIGSNCGRAADENARKLDERNSEDEGSESEGEDQGESVLTKEEESELTNKFLDGKLSFSEYATLMKGYNAEDSANDSPYAVSSATVDAFEKELREATEVGKKSRGDADAIGEVEGQSRRAAPRRRRRRGLPPALQGLMGEANLRYARGQRDVAISMCLEIIRQMPTAPEPFHTLSVLYEEMGAADKALQCALIAAHLSPHDGAQWVRLAESSEERGDIKQAITCFSKAVIADPGNAQLHLKRCALLENLGDRRAALRGYLKLLAVLPADEGPTLLRVAKETARKFHEDGDLVKAKEAMDAAFTKASHLVASEDVNLMLELLIGLKDYNACLEVLVQHCGIEVEAEWEAGAGEDVQALKILACNMPESLPIDLQGKLIIVMIYLKAFHLVDGLLNYFVERQDPEVSGDLFLDVAEALMAEAKHGDALTLLNPLVNSRNYSLAAVWLRQGECLKACGRLREAADALEVVVRLAPQHFEARVELSALWSALGEAERAVAVLTQDAATEALQPALLLRRCELLRDAGPSRQREFLAVVQLLMYRHCPRIRNRDELDALTRLRRLGKKSEALLEVRATRGEPALDADAPSFAPAAQEPEPQVEWELLQRVLRVCADNRDYPLLQRLAFSALGSRKFHSNPTIVRETEFACLIACLYNGDEYYGYNFARDHILRHLTYPRAWNLFNLIIQRADDVRHNRFVMRLLARTSAEHKALTVLHANNCLVSGTYKYALSEYTTVYKSRPCAPLAFYVGVTLFQMACQKFSAKKHSLVTQALAFFSQYERLRGAGGSQEVHYNLGRAFHQLGLLPAAAAHYEAALAARPPLAREFPETHDLSREAAFNLHLIYMHSGNHDLARTYIDKYIVV